MDKLRPCPFCKSNNVRIFNILRKPIEIVCNECHSIYPNLIEPQESEEEQERTTPGVLICCGYDPADASRL